MSDQVLLVLTTTKPGIRALPTALDACERLGAQLAVLFIVDRALTSDAARDALVKFIGAAAAPVSEEISRDYEERAIQRFDEIRGAAAERGVRVETRLAQGIFEQEVRAFVLAHRPKLIVIPHRKRSFLSSLFVDRALASLKAKLGDHPIQQVEED